ncbi:MAG: DUF1616 domain-containing protein [Candidatus Heimdallarchaeota archaeon]
MKDKRLREALFLGVLFSLILLSSLLFLQLVTSPPRENFSEIAILGSHGLADDYPTGFSHNSSYQVRIVVRNFEGQVEFYQIRIQLQFQDGQTLGFTPTIAFSDGARIGRSVENKRSWDVMVTIGNGSQILDRQEQVFGQSLKVEFVLLFFRDGVFQATGNSVHLWAHYLA